MNGTNLHFILGFGAALIVAGSSSALAHAADETTDLECQIRINLETKLTARVTPNPKEKVFIGEADGVRAYLQEKSKGLFVIDAHIADEGIRIYSEGHLRAADDHLVASAWGRATMVDVKCRPIGQLP